MSKIFTPLVKFSGLLLQKISISWGQDWILLILPSNILFYAVNKCILTKTLCIYLGLEQISRHCLFLFLQQAEISAQIHYNFLLLQNPKIFVDLCVLWILDKCLCYDITHIV